MSLSIGIVGIRGVGVLCEVVHVTSNDHFALKSSSRQNIILAQSSSSGGGNLESDLSVVFPVPTSRLSGHSFKLANVVFVFAVLS